MAALRAAAAEEIFKVPEAFAAFKFLSY